MVSLIPRIIWSGNETVSGSEAGFWSYSHCDNSTCWRPVVLDDLWQGWAQVLPKFWTLLSTWRLLPHQSTHTSCTIVLKMVEWVDKCVYSCALRIIASYLKVLWPRLHILYVAARWSASMLHAGNKGFIKVKEWPSSEPPKCLEILTQFCFLSMMFVSADGHAAIWRPLV